MIDNEQLFVDTVFIQALLNQRDHLHQEAKKLFATVRMAQKVWMTEAVLTEVGNALGSSYRTTVGRFINNVIPQIIYRLFLLIRNCFNLLFTSMFNIEINSGV